MKSKDFANRVFEAIRLKSYDHTDEFEMNNLYEYDPNRGAPGRATPQTHITGNTDQTRASASRSEERRRNRETEKYGEGGARARAALRTARRPGGTGRVGHRFTDTELKGEPGRLINPQTGNLSDRIGPRGKGRGGYSHVRLKKLEPRVDHTDMQTD